MDILTKLGVKHQTDKAIPHNFTAFYDEHLSSFRNSFESVLEIGVSRKGSLRMWRDYFVNANVYGIDIDPASMFFEDRIKTYLISQTDEESLNHAFSGMSFDLIVDDGSHMTSHQINSFKHLHKKVKPGGFFVVEDLHASFMPEYIDTEVTAFDFLKNIDKDEYGIFTVDFFHNMDTYANVDCITSIVRFK